MTELALAVELSVGRQRARRRQSSGERRKDRHVRQVLRRDRTELLRVAQQIDRSLKTVYRVAPPLLEVVHGRDQDFLAQRTIRFAHLPLLPREQEVQVLWRAVGLPEDRHHLQDVDVEPFAFDEVQARRGFAPEVLELQPLGLEQGVDQVEDVEPDAAAVDLGEDVTDLVQIEIAVELDVGDLVLLGNTFQVLAECSGVGCMSCRSFGRRTVAGLRCLLFLGLPVLLVILNPVGQRPSALPDHGERKHVAVELRCAILKELLAAQRPVVLERLIVRLLHELIDTDEVEEPVLAAGCRHFRRQEGVVHGGQPLLAVKHDVRGVRLALKPIDRLTGQRGEVLGLALPEQQTPDVVVQEDRAQQFSDVPGLPLEFPLEVGDDVAAFAQAADQRGQTDMVGLLRVLHDLPPMISPSKPSVSFSSARMSARISSSVRSGCGL